MNLIDFQTDNYKELLEASQPKQSKCKSFLGFGCGTEGFIGTLSNAATGFLAGGPAGAFAGALQNPMVTPAAGVQAAAGGLGAGTGATGGGSFNPLAWLLGNSPLSGRIGTPPFLPPGTTVAGPVNAAQTVPQGLPAIPTFGGAAGSVSIFG